jgi:ABC-2 type transport system permease protein
MTDFIHRLLALIRKELLSVLKDKSSRTILIGPVIMQSLLFGYAATYDLSNAPYVVLDQSRSPTSTALLAKLDGTGFFRRVASVSSTAELEAAIDTQQALLAIRIDARFESQWLAGQTATVQLILDARNSTTANAAASSVAAVVDAFNAERREREGIAAPPLVIETRAWFNPNLQTRWNFMPALIATLSMMQTLLLTALSVAREREQGTFDQLLVTPMTPTEIMIGKAIPPVLIGLVQATIVLAITRWWFQIPMVGSLPLLYVGLAAFLAAGVGIGLTISALSLNMQQAMLYTFVLLMPMMLLSGLTTPVATMPEVLQVATLANPIRFGIDMVRQVYLEGAGLPDVWQDLLPLLLIAAATLPAAAWLFRNRLA